MLTAVMTMSRADRGIITRQSLRSRGGAESHTFSIAMVFSISEEPGQFLTYVLDDRAAQARLKVVPERGGIITHWQVQGQDVLYFDAQRFADPTQSVRGGIPILFPICGNLPDNTYTLDGQTYTLKQHGFARDLPWRVIDRAITDAAALTLELTSTAETRAVYPFNFCLTFTYQVQGDRLVLRQRHQNRSDRPMPFSTGLHPYFWVQDKLQLSFSLPATQQFDHITQATSAFGGGFDVHADEVDVALRPLSATQATVHDAQRHLTLTMQWSAAYSALVFWTVKGKDYYCLEPWSAGRNAMNTGDHLLWLDPQEVLETEVVLTANFAA